LTTLKRNAFERGLCHGLTKLVVVPHEALRLPGGLQYPAELHYGDNLPIPTKDLSITDAGVEGTLSFSRTPTRTFVPWDAVVVVAGEGFAASFTFDPEVLGEKPKERARPKLGLVS
jgi:hypothetical protein